MQKQFHFFRRIQTGGHRRITVEMSLALLSPPAPFRHQRAENATIWISVQDIERLFVQGDETALRSAYDAHGALIYSFCRRTVGGETAHDVTQEVFLAAWKARDRFDPERGTLAGWLVGIAKNKVLDTLRRRQVHLLGDEPEQPADVTGPDLVDATADRMLIAAALEELSPRMKQVLTMAYLQDLTHDQISRQTSLPLGTVKSDIRRGLDRLRRNLDRHHD
jgi:RNA polymerase sigma factor (sigma-70 family)